MPKRSGVDKAQILTWEKRASCMMGDDLKSFYLTTNGLLLTWCAKVTADAKIAVGHMEINALEGLQRLGGPGTGGERDKPALTDIEDSDDEGDTDAVSPRFDHRSRIFELDPCGGYGKVCYVYRNAKPGIPAQKAEVWFLDRALNWHFLSDSFLGYFRLMLTHLGLPHWQYAFTDIGIPPQAQQWFNLYCPVRLRLNDSVSHTPGTQPSANHLSADRVFKGKTDKKKQSAAQGAARKKPNVPSAGKSQNSGVSRSSSQGSPNKPMR